MDAYKIINHREEKLEYIDSILAEISRLNEGYKFIFNDKINIEKRNFLIYLIGLEKDDIFQLGFTLRKKGINKFYDLFKEKLDLLENKKKSIEHINLDNNFKEIEILKKEIEKFSETIKESEEKFIKYPFEITTLLNKIFNNEDVNNQEDVLYFKKTTFKFYELKNKKIQKDILSYYNIYQDYTLFTDGSNLENEYSFYKNINDFILSTNKSITFNERNIDMLIEENKIFNSIKKEIDNITTDIKERILEDFISFATKEDMVDFYIDKIIDNSDIDYIQLIDQDYLRNYFRYRYQKEFSNYYINQITKVTSGIETDLLNIKKIIKQIYFIKYLPESIENIEIISNIGYFENKIVNFYNVLLNFFSSLKNINLINSEHLHEFHENLKKYNKDFLLLDFLNNIDNFSLFDKNEIEKMNRQKDYIVKTYKIKK